jgi:hypothetical protein
MINYPSEEEKLGFQPEAPSPAENLSVPQSETAEQFEGRSQSPAEQEGFLDETIETLKKKLKSQKKKTSQMPLVRDKLTVEVEQIMEAGLQDAYKELTPVQQQQFKIKGEETAWQVRQLLRAAHVQVKKIFRLLLEWLKMLPGINRFFLEQEAKIKTDKILSLHERHKQ